MLSGYQGIFTLGAIWWVECSLKFDALCQLNKALRETFSNNPHGPYCLGTM